MTCAIVRFPVMYINAPVLGKNREYQVIELVQQIAENSSLSLYADLWSYAGFAITRNYAIMKYTTTPFQFASTPLPRQVSDFRIVETMSEESTAWRLIDLVVPLLRTGRYHDYFDLWGNAGFHITPIPAPRVETLRFKPSLFLLGAAKSGTTTLYSYLTQVATKGS